MSSTPPLNLSDFPVQINRVFLSSAFTQRMTTDESLFHKRSITLDDAKSLISLAEIASNIEFTNAVNPHHTSTAVLTSGLTNQECQGGFLSLVDGDVVVVIQPQTASRNATEFELKNFQECQFDLVQRLPASMIKES